LKVLTFLSQPNVDMMMMVIAMMLRVCQWIWPWVYFPRICGYYLGIKIDFP